MQFWPRVRAKREYARMRSWPSAKEAKPLGFAGYKVGMTHVLATDNRATSTTKGKDIMLPVTVIECPPLKAISLVFYSNTQDGRRIVGEVFSDNLDKEVSKKLSITKSKVKPEDIADFDDVFLKVMTQPKLTGLGKKKPEVFEVALGGKKDEKVAYGKEKLGKEIPVSEAVAEGMQIDLHAVTQGKGFQGPMKRFGISRRSHRSEKSIRNPGSLGPWNAQGKIMYRVPHAGKMGYHTRTEYNKWLVKVGDKPDEIVMDGGFLHYGAVKNPYLLVKGGVAGPSKRLIRFGQAIRPNTKTPKEAPSVTYISTKSKQGN